MNRKEEIVQILLIAPLAVTALLILYLTRRRDRPRGAEKDIVRTALEAFRRRAADIAAGGEKRLSLDSLFEDKVDGRMTRIAAFTVKADDEPPLQAAFGLTPRQTIRVFVSVTRAKKAGWLKVRSEPYVYEWRFAPSASESAAIAAAFTLLDVSTSAPPALAESAPIKTA